MPASESALARRIQNEETGPTCGFCNDGRHTRCARTIIVPVRKATPERPSNNGIWICGCKECGGGALGAHPLRCMTCKMEHPQDVDETTRLCIDKDACAARVQARLDRDPTMQFIQRRSEMAKTETKPAKAPAAPKVGKCLVTGKPTKGGKFLPGMDAKYVSLAVEAVVSKTETESAARKRIATETSSEKLVAKFDKSLTLRKERIAKSNAAAAEKKAAKAEADKAKASTTK